MFGIRHKLLLAAVLIFLLGMGGCGAPGEDEAVEEKIAEEEVAEEKEDPVDEAEEMVLLYSEDRWEEVGELAYSPLNDTLAVSARSDVYLYSPATREKIGEPVGFRQTRSLDFSPDGSILVTAGNGVSLYSVQDQTKIASLHGGGECRATFSPDGEMLASHPTQASSEVYLWERVNSVEFEKVAEFAPDGDMIHDLEFTPDSKYLAGAFRDGKVRLWDVESHELVNTFNLDGSGGTLMDFSPDGKTLAVKAPDISSKIQLFNLEDYSHEKDLDIHEGQVFALEFSPDGTRLAYGGYDGVVKILDTSDWSVLYSFEHEGSVRGLSFSPDSKSLAVGAGKLYLYGYR